MECFLACSPALTTPYLGYSLFARRTCLAVDSFFFSSRRRHTRYWRDWSSDVCSSDLASANLRSMQKVLDPVVAAQGATLGPLKLVAGMLLAVEVGALSGILAARVLGQYEFPVTDPDAPARLLFVGPNLAQAARSLDADDDSLTRWVALHETTHALQFAGVPWLRSHMAARIGELVRSLDVKVNVRNLKLPRLDDLRAL